MTGSLLPQSYDIPVVWIVLPNDLYLSSKCLLCFLSLKQVLTNWSVDRTIDGSIRSNSFWWIKLSHMFKKMGITPVNCLKQENYSIMIYTPFFKNHFFSLQSMSDQTTMGTLEGICRFSGNFLVEENETYVKYSTCSPSWFTYR